MKLQFYVVVSNDNQGCIVAANNKNEAIKIAQKERLNAFGLDEHEGWIVETIENYFNEEHLKPHFYGWIVHPDQMCYE